MAGMQIHPQGGVKNYHPQRGVGWYGGELVIGLRVGWGGVKIIVYFWFFMKLQT